ncbi:hypothetical protein [Clostridium sp.]|uniref:hypothetical protein n=1 Tax=Clostridium sp. TaxID=1506 RepID=UPI002FC930E7
MINKIIKDLLKDICPDIHYQKASNKTDKYIIFSIYDEEDTMIYDDNNLSETYYITVNYWYKNPSDIVIYKKIKEKLKSNGFTFDGAADLVDGEYYGKNMDFIYEELI